MRTRYTQHAAEALRSEASRSGNLRLRVSGRSMAPLLQPGDFLDVQAVGPQQLRLGDVVVLQDAAGFLTHRLVAIQGQQLLTKGDALALLDPPLPPTALVGRVQTVEREGRVRFDLTRRAWQSGQRWLAGLSRLEGQMMTWRERRTFIPRRLQGYLVRAACLPVRWMGFLLQWGIRLLAGQPARSGKN
jgi:hypothetical protein